MAYEINEQKKIGIGLIGFGITFTFLGVILFFDMGLLALGNIFCLSGVAVLLGWHSTWQLFTRRTSYKGSVSFLVGFFLIFIGWPIVGVILESYGSIVLFSGFWPACKAFLCHIPILGWLFQYSFLFFDRFKLKSGS
ncbi:vesicle transport protein GOT1 isoform X2 [Amborella trichopoda]|uniref:vesicle transport protein GOT1 isoform X2 n=1 Tax=Amborella trichopoda TaxID=13333 RepID=UPI0005D44D99|nr:vesicle transport protein GOT1 isoform X2 [Amborella trichopoda]|eukprot:XP_011628662.1 vesicle transport protein GOT1 isoform X2 [Amborella trichopoda]